MLLLLTSEKKWLPLSLIRKTREYSRLEMATLSCVHSELILFSDQLAAGGSECPLPTPFHSPDPIHLRYIYVFPEMKLCSLPISNTELQCFVSQFLNSYICERFIYFHNRSVYFAAAKYVDRSWEYINRSQTHECENCDWGSATPRKRIQKGDFHCSAVNWPLQTILNNSFLAVWNQRHRSVRIDHFINETVSGW